jgi:hypothetical protein
MPCGDAELSLEQALGRIEESILPNLALMLDSLLDAASLARPGADAEAHAAEIRTLAVELESVGRQVEALAAFNAADAAAYPAASAA